MTPLFPSLQIALQNVFCTHTDLSATLFRNNAVVAGGSYCSATGNDVNAFASLPVAAIAANFSSFVKTLPAAFNGLVLMDLEFPVFPDDWHLQPPAFFSSLKSRIDIARKLLPTAAKLGVYGVVYAPPFDNLNNWLNGGRYSGYETAVKAGCFASADYLCPVCPALWGPGDSASQIASAVPNVLNAIKYTNQLGAGKLIAPVLRWLNYTATSKSLGQPISPSVLAEQINAATSTNLVDAIVFWGVNEAEVNLATIAAIGGNSSPIGVVK